MTLRNPSKDYYFPIILVKFIIIITLTLFYPSNLNSETLILRSGEIYKVKVIDTTPKEIVVKDETGKVKKYLKNQILKLVFKDIDKQEAEKIKVEEEKKLEKKEKKNKPIEVVKEEPVIEQKTQPSLWKAILKSAILPGWAQWGQDRKIASGVYFGLFAMSGYGTYVKWREYKNAVRDYNQMGNPYIQSPPAAATLIHPIGQYMYNKPYEDQRHTVERHFREYQRFGVLTAMIWAINIADAFYFQKKINNSGISIQVLPELSSINPGRIVGTEYRAGIELLFE